MNKTTAALVLIGTFAALLAGNWLYWIENRNSDTKHLLPWQIERTPDGATVVFGLTLGQSNLVAAEKIFNAADEISLFVAPDGKLTVEGYFDSVGLAGLDARIIAVVELPNDRLQQIYNRGTRISSLSGGTHKVSLSAIDLLQVRDQPISSLTYMPKISLKPEQIEHRFGKPKMLIQEPKQGSNHWLYPDQGLDVILGSGPPILQYVLPRKFSLLLDPLTNHNR